MVFELIGPAGCGKTTVARLVDRALDERGVAHVGWAELEDADRHFGEKRITRYNFPGKTWMLLPLFLRHPSVVAGVFVLALLHGPPRKRRIRQANRALAHVGMVERLARREPDRVLVLHEGLLQMLWSTTVESEALRGRWIVRHLLRRYQRIVAPRGILFRIDDRSAQARVFQRTSGNRFSVTSSEQRRRDFPRWLTYHRELVALAPPGLVAATVDATRPADTLARNVTDAILACIVAPGAGSGAVSALEDWRAKHRSL